MAMNTRGTALYFYDKTNSSVVHVGCPTEIPDFERTREVYESAPCLETGKTKKFTGALTHEDVEIAVNFDITSASHLRLREMLENGDEDVPFIIGFSDGTSAPTWTTNDWAADNMRSWMKFTASPVGDKIGWPESSAVTGSFTITPDNLVLEPKA